VKALLEGAVAGFGIAIPVGPITILVFETALRRGFWSALPGAAGAASADFLFAATAAVAGTGLATWLEPHARTLRVTGATVLIAIAAYRMWSLFHRPEGRSPKPPDRSPWRTYLAFLGLTLTNPLTITYFAALIVGLQGDTLSGPGSKGLFVIGAAGASLSWQALLAAAGSVFHRRMPAGARLVTGVAGNLVIALLAVRLFVQA